MKTALLIAAHGSPVHDANADLVRIAADIRSAGKYDLVEVCFLESNEPSIPQAIGNSVQSGAGRIIVIPYFLHAGRHVVLDVPAVLEEARSAYPGLEFRLAEHLGCSPVVTQVIRARAESAAETR